MNRASSPNPYLTSISPRSLFQKFRENGALALFQALRTRDKVVVAFLSVVVAGAVFYWIGAIYVSSTEVVADRGGRYIEGVIGQPRYVNPVLSLANSADEDLVHAVYSGLLRYDADGRVRNDLAERVDVSGDGKEYTVTIREGAKWHDGIDVSADDVAFTVGLIKNPAYKSPLQKNWQGVDAELVDNRTVRFILKKAYFGFPEHLTVGILPKHVWESVPPEGFALADPNIAPVGSGPYRFFDYQKDSNGNILSYELRAFPEYFDGEANITKLVFNFYPDEESLSDAFSKKEIMGMASVSLERTAELSGRKGTAIHEFSLPRIFAVFFNPVKSVPLAYPEVREALSKATDRDALVREALLGKGMAAPLPFLPFMEGNPDIPDMSYDVDAANRILDEKGWARGEDGIRSKGGTALAFQLAVPAWLELEKTADVIKAQWERIGARVEVKASPLSELNQDVIRPRNYDAVLYGEEMRINPDFYSFWHSSEKGETGFNLAMFADDDADETLLALREESDPDRRRELLGTFLRILSEKYPAVFLYSPDASYVMDDSVKGFDIRSANNASCRLSDLSHWYIETKRIRKK